MIDVFRSAGEAAYGDAVALRRQLHAHPELAFEEFETARLISETLTELGIEHKKGVARTGVVGYIDGGRPGPTVALRADMDALPIHEENTFDFRSRIPGVMHACGHDSHVATLLTAARLLADRKEEIHGRIRLLFQPSEERVPGGAIEMIRDGALDPAGDRPAVDLVFGQHVRPDLPAGVLGVRPGAFMAASDEVYITVDGQGGHAAEPHKLSADPVYAAAQIIVSLQTVISRNRPPGTPSVLSICRVDAGRAPNVIPDQVVLAGTFRSMDEAWRDRGHELIARVAEHTAEALGATASVDIHRGYPALYNDEAAADTVRSAAVSFVGEDRVVDLDRWYVAEDFTYYLRERPGCFYVIGTGNEQAGIVHGLHTPRFTIDESALKTGPAFMAYLAWHAGATA